MEGERNEAAVNYLLKLYNYTALPPTIHSVFVMTLLPGIFMPHKKLIIKNFSMKIYQLQAAPKWLLVLTIAALLFPSCRKENKLTSAKEPNGLPVKSGQGHLQQTKTYSSEVAFKWMDMQLRLIRTNATPLGGLPPQRFYAYSSIALYESVVPGMPAYQSLSGQLTNMPAMPETMQGYAYHWPCCGNAAMAAMSRNFFPNTSEANKASIDSLESALNSTYQSEVDNETFQRSIQFGKSIAQLVFEWSKTDGASVANAAYYAPTGPGYWVPTPPANLPAFGAHWGENRLMVAGSLNGSSPPAPPTYSTDPSSDYYKMVKEVYDISQTLTPEQTATALYYRDNPGYGGGHYLSILEQVLEQEHSPLNITALVFAKVSIAIIDAGIGCWKAKYTYNLERPITYIRNVLGHTTWNSLFPTPNFPEWTSGHSAIAGAVAETLTGFFGNNYHLTNHTYDYLGMAPRTYTSFYDMAQDIGDSRVYAGIHYKQSCAEGIIQGIKIAQNINSMLKFLKE